MCDRRGTTRELLLSAATVLTSRLVIKQIRGRLAALKKRVPEVHAFELSGCEWRHLTGAPATIQKKRSSGALFGKGRSGHAGSLQLVASSAEEAGGWVAALQLLCRECGASVRAPPMLSRADGSSRSLLKRSASRLLGIALASKRLGSSKLGSSKLGSSKDVGASGSYTSMAEPQAIGPSEVGMELYPEGSDREGGGAVDASVPRSCVHVRAHVSVRPEARSESTARPVDLDALSAALEHARSVGVPSALLSPAEALAAQLTDSMKALEVAGAKGDVATLGALVKEAAALGAPSECVERHARRLGELERAKANLDDETAKPELHDASLEAAISAAASARLPQAVLDTAMRDLSNLRAAQNGLSLAMKDVAKHVDLDAAIKAAQHARVKASTVSAAQHALQKVQVAERKLRELMAKVEAAGHQLVVSEFTLVLKEAKAAGVRADLVEAASELLRTRQSDISKQLSEAALAIPLDYGRIETVVQNAKRLGAAEKEIAQAENALKQARKKEKHVHDLQSSFSAHPEPAALESAIESALKAGVPPAAVREASALVQKAREAEAALEHALLTPGHLAMLEKAVEVGRACGMSASLIKRAREAIRRVREADQALSAALRAPRPTKDAIEGALRKAQDAKVAAATIDQARTEFETIKQTVARELLHRLEKDAAVDIAAITELVAQGQRVGIQSAVLDLARERCANAERTSHAILQLLSHPPVLYSKLKGLVEQAREYRLPNDSGSPRFAAETKLEAMGVVLTELELAMKSFAQQDDDRNRQRLLAVLLEVESMQLQPANLMQVERVAWRVLCTRLEPVKPEFIAVEDAREVATIYEAVLRINLSHLRQLLGAAELRASPAATTLDTAVKDAYQKGKPFALPSLQNLATALQAAKRAHVEIESKMGLEVLLRPQLVAQLQKLQAADDYHTTTKYVKELTSLLMSLTSNGVLASRRMPARACQRRWCWGTRARAAAPVLPLPARVRRALP